MKQIRKIIVSTGATGGHIFPAIVVANKAREMGLDVEFILSNPRVDPGLINFKIHMVPSAPIVGKKTYLAMNLLKIFAGTIKSMPMTMLNKSNSIMLATGAFPSVPPLLAASISGLDFYIMEQNVVPGATVKAFASRARAVFTSFPETSEYLEGTRTIFTGNPIRKLTKYENPKKFVGLKESQKVVLVVGGSQGAKKLAEIALNAAKKLTDMFFFIQCGKANLEHFKRIGLVGPNYKIEPFFDDMGLMYSLADVVVSRAGAGTIFEVLHFGIPLILVPLEIARGHQIENARSLVKRKAAIMELESNLTPESLAEKIIQLTQNENLRDSMVKAQINFAPSNPEDKILNFIMEDQN